MLASGVIFSLASGNDGDESDPVPGFGGSVALACVTMLAAAGIAALSYNKDFGEGGLNCGPCLSSQKQGKRGGGGGGAGGGFATMSSKSPSGASPQTARPGSSALKGAKTVAAAAAGAASAAVEAPDVEKAAAAASK